MTGEHLLRPWHEDDVSGQGSAAGQHGLKPFSGEGDASTASGGYQCWSERLGHAGERGTDASGQQHQRRELARVPLWPVAAVVGSVLRGIRIICNCVGVQATRCDSGTRWQTCLCNRVRAAISSTRRQRLRVGPSITHRQYRYRRRGVCNGLQSPGAGVRA
jgi:hypothetical protein